MSSSKKRQPETRTIGDFAVLHVWSRTLFLSLAVALIAAYFVLGSLWPDFLWSGVVLFPLIAMGVYDTLQTRKTILRNFPLLGHVRYLFESIRPEIRQYFIESDIEEHPFSREQRSVVYQRAKSMTDTIPFGTQRNVYRDDYQWIAHSLDPAHPPKEENYVEFGTGRCSAPYRASRLNVSAMSYGALSKNAVLALNKGAKKGGFWHNTGEGGISPYHLEPGGDLVWQIGTGYFGCRDEKGRFNPELFRAQCEHANVKMVEVKLSQGAKPAHGGVLPAEKVTSEISKIRHVPMGEDVLSPPKHTAFDSPTGLLEFVTELREMSGGKPVGIKLCIGRIVEFFALAKAMQETGLFPDFITVDGAEGGTGAAPLEYANSVGMPLESGLNVVHSTLVGLGLRDQLRLVAAGKITTGFHMVVKTALGADVCNSARAMMFALGCIQALKCNTNSCPTGVATQDPKLVGGLYVPDKAERVYRFHDKTVASFLEILGSSGVSRCRELRPSLIYRRAPSGEHRSLDEHYPVMPEGALTEGRPPKRWEASWNAATSASFHPST